MFTWETCEDNQPSSFSNSSQELCRKKKVKDLSFSTFTLRAKITIKNLFPFTLLYVLFSVLFPLPLNFFLIPPPLFSSKLTSICCTHPNFLSYIYFLFSYPWEWNFFLSNHSFATDTPGFAITFDSCYFYNKFIKRDIVPKFGPSCMHSLSLSLSDLLPQFYSKIYFEHSLFYYQNNKVIKIMSLK